MLLTVTIYNNRNERGKATSPDNREDTGRNRGQCQWSGGPGPEDTHTHTDIMRPPHTRPATIVFRAAE